MDNKRSLNSYIWGEYMKKNGKKICKCVGCGLCKPVLEDRVEMKIDKDGFNRPFIFGEGNEGEMEFLCPLTYNVEKYSKNIWGEYQGVYLGHSLDPSIRKKGSSGGVITQALIYLLEEKKIDGVIHSGQSLEKPLENITTISFTKEEIIKNAGSRYAPTSPLENIKEYLKMDKKFAFVGKPCDVRALRNYAKRNKEVDAKILYIFSFFCMGTPSYLGTELLIKKMGFSKEEIKSFDYRGNGWPGYATAITYSGDFNSMGYDQSWGKILGKMLQPYCRWCMDGVGEFADISCGDAWYLNENRKPKFDEAEGRNVIFGRSKKGNQLLTQMHQGGVIKLEDFSEKIFLLQYMNYAQYYRRATMLGRILGLKVLGRDLPYNNIKDLYYWSKNVSKYENLKAFAGSVLRGMKGKY